MAGSGGTLFLSDVRELIFPSLFIVEIDKSRKIRTLITSYRVLVVLIYTYNVQERAVPE